MRRVVVDSNVWVSGLIRPQGPPGLVLSAFLQGRIEDVLDLLQTLVGALPTVDVDVEIRDPDDAPVVAAALAGRADAIVTGDADLLENDELREWLKERGVQLLTPRELASELDLL